MAALSIGHSMRKTNTQIQEQRPKNCPRFLILLSCQRGDSIETSNPKAKKEMKEEKQGFMSLEKLGKSLKDNWSPKRKGDWKDVALMSLSFAVYVYISQKIVCAYCAWMSILNSNQW